MERCRMMSPFNIVRNTRETYDRFHQRNITEVEVQFQDETPTWIPLETLIAIKSYLGISDE